MRQKKAGDYIGSMFGSVVALVLINLVLIWRPLTQGVILESWVDILWAADLSLVIQVIGNLLLLFYRPAWFDALLRMLFAAASLLSLIVFFIVFPIDFSGLVGEWLNTTIRVVLLVGMVGSFIAGIVSMVRFVSGGVQRAA